MARQGERNNYTEKRNKDLQKETTKRKGNKEQSLLDSKKEQANK